MKRNEGTIRSIEKYTERMARLSSSGVYDIDRIEFSEDIEKYEELGDIYSTVCNKYGIILNSPCEKCEQDMLWNEQTEDFYCPVCKE